MWYTTKVIVELEISTQFGPDAAFHVIRSNLDFAAIQKRTVIKAESTIGIDKLPTDKFVPIEIPEWVNK
jgi:hypothetical protein